jgi:HlyD family secretion protein
MPVGGIAQQILVKEGEAVKSGQVLIELDAEATSQKQKSVIQSQKLRLKQLQEKAQQMKLKDAELERYLQINKKEEETLAKNLALQEEILRRYKTLSEQGATAELQYLDQKNKVEETQGKLSTTKVDRLRQKAILDQQIQQLNSESNELKSQLSDLTSQLTEANVTLRYQSLRSPVDGLVFDLKPKSRGYAAQGTETVMKVVPYSALEAKVEIPSSKIGFVRRGMPADVSIDSFPATDFGVLEGTVTKISSDALPPDPQNQKSEYRYPATIKLASQKLKLKSGERLPLQVGMSLTAHIKLRKVSYLQLLLSDFKNKTDSLKRL